MERPTHSDLNGPVKRVDYSDHPSLELLAAYHEKGLEAEAEEEVRGHLIQCLECSEILLGLADAAEYMGADSPSDADSTEFSRAWARQWSMMQPSREGFEQKDLAQSKRPSYLAWWIAAAAIFVTLGMAFWMAVAQRTLDDLRQPQINSPILSLAPLGTERTILDPPASVEWPPGTSRAWLILNLLETTASRESFVVVFIASDGRVAWRQEGLVINDSGSFRIELPKDLLPPGSYRLVISRSGHDIAQPMAEYRLLIPPNDF